MKISILTIFPEMFDSPLNASILKRAQERDIVNIDIVDFRDFAESKHKNVDDLPYGGGAGMLLKPEPIYAAFEASVTGQLNELITNNYVLSNQMNASNKYTLKTGITYEDSRDDANAGDPDFNNFDIDVYRAVARVRLGYASSSVLAVSDGLGTLQATSLQFAMRNINRQVNLFQWFNNADAGPTAWPQAPFYNEFATWSTTDLGNKELYRPYYYNGYTMGKVLDVYSTSPAVGDYVIVTENTNALPRIGNTTYARIDAVFLPAAGKVVTAFTYDNVNSRFALGATVNTSAITTPTTFYKLNIEFAGLTASGTFADNLPAVLFTDPDLASKAAYCIENGYDTGWTSGWTSSNDKLLNTYTGGMCYYRLNIRQTVPEVYAYGVKRNYSYNSNITKFSTIGVSTADELEEYPETPLGELTHVTATINVIPWIEVDQTDDI